MSRRNSEGDLHGGTDGDTFVDMTTATKSRPKGRKASAPRQDVAKIVVDRIIEKLKEGEVIWHKTWQGDAGMPRSLSTGKLYRGINQFILAFAGFSSPWWGTYKQISERGGQVRKDEKHTKVIWWSRFTKEVEVNGEKKEKAFFSLRQFQVFNVEQCDWADDAKLPKPPKVLNEGERLEACEAIVAEYIARGPSLGHGGDSAHYVPSRDHVQLPEFAAFEGPEEYYSTAFHELTHSTGHSSRLARQGVAEGTFGGFGSKVYSNEELVAELGAAILCGHAGIEQEAVLDNSAAYLAHWIKVLEEDPKVIITAAAQAQRAVDLILGTKFESDEQGEEG